MDETEHNALSGVPVHALSMRLLRTPIRMHHGAKWRVDKVNPGYDLLICLTGKGHYTIDNEIIVLSPGDALLIPPYTRFKGRHGGGDEPYTGVAQHFSLDLFDRGDLLRRMRLKRKVSLRGWPKLAPVVQFYHDLSPVTSTTLQQHHLFMSLLIHFIDDAFIDWQTEDLEPQSQDQLSLQIMLVASRLASDPVGTIDAEVMKSVSFNEDYFRRAFRDRIGATPRQYREQKRMEFAVHRLGQGLSVKEVAAELGYADPYFFSRMFKRHIGASPSNYRVKRTGLVNDPGETYQHRPSLPNT